MNRVLVVGGTGPSGFATVERLLERGDDVTVLHSGAHEPPFSGSVTHLHGDNSNPAELTALVSGSYDHCVATSGKITAIVHALRGHVEKLVAVSGLPAYAGVRHVGPEGHRCWQLPIGTGEIPMPLREEINTPAEVNTTAGRFSARVQEGERAVLDAHDGGDFAACVLRYTMVYGRYAYKPFEWYFVRRALDGRRRVVLEAGGMMMPQRGYAENLAEAVLLALDRPESGGEVFNVGDEHVLSVRAIADLVAEELEHEWEIVSVPVEFSPCGNPFSLRQNAVFDLTKIRTRLGYRDVVPAARATRIAAAWLRDNPPRPGSPEDRSIGEQAFDYLTEDGLLDTWDRVLLELAKYRRFEVR
jgi:nucleoside-diphosphate-sugar epimerase